MSVVQHAQAGNVTSKTQGQETLIWAKPCLRTHLALDMLNWPAAADPHTVKQYNTVGSEIQMHTSHKDERSVNKKRLTNLKIPIL